ncbi:MAG TPA: hypothetical protein VG943_17205 [Caulobacterales bacterium]|nr:hypothetical protein [Caulobacterales bacterium]
MGAGAVGGAAALALRAAGWAVRATSRNPAPPRPLLQEAGVEIVRFDLAYDDIAPLLDGVSAAILIPPLTLSARVAPALQGRRVIAFSSNNVALDPNAPVYRALRDAETELRRHAPGAIVLRPTLIYGDPRLPTLPQVMRLAMRTPVLPVPGSGRALQQPIFHEDLGRVAAQLAMGETQGGATFAIGGPDIVSMRVLFAKTAKAVGAHPFLVAAPSVLLRAGRVVLGSRFPFDAAQIARVNQDRIAIEQTPLPEMLKPRVTLDKGLARLAAALAA